MAIVPERSDGRRRKRPKRCIAKDTCLDLQGDWGRDLRPVCPAFKEMLSDAVRDMVPDPLVLGSTVEERLKRLLMLCGKLTQFPPSAELVALWAHREDLLSEWVNLIQDDLLVVPKQIQKNYPMSATKLETLAEELVFFSQNYEMNRASRGWCYLEPPDYAQQHWRAFRGWRKDKIDTASLGGGHRTPIEVLRFTSTYPVDIICVASVIFEELAPLAIARASTDENPNGQGSASKTKISKEEANVRARRLLTETPTWDWTARMLAKQIPLPAWRAYHERRQELQRKGTIKTVSLTDTMEAVLGKGDKDEVLNQLIAEQEDDDRKDGRQAKLYLSQEKKPKRRESGLRE